MTVWGIKDRKALKKVKPPWHKRWWAITFYLLAGTCLAIVGTFLLTEEVITQKHTEDVKYTWTDENGVVHFSDSKQSTSANEVIAPKTPFETKKDRVLNDMRRARALVVNKLKSRKKEITIAAIVAVVSVFLGIGIRTGYRIRKKRGQRKQKEGAVRGFIEDIKEFHSTLKLGMDKKDYYMKLSDIKVPLEKYLESQLHLEERHEETLEILQKVMQTYTDGTVLWGINSHEELAWADRNGYFIKYPALIKLIGDSVPSKQPINKIVRTTVWKYASMHLEEAEAVFVGSHATTNPKN
jgi:hypothetical protein